MEFVALIEDLPEGSLLGAELTTGERVCLANVGGRVVAISDHCTHQDFPMADGTILPDGTIECAWHGARFCSATGEAVRPPATDPIAMFEVKVEDGRIHVGKRTRS